MDDELKKGRRKHDQKQLLKKKFKINMNKTLELLFYN